MSAEVRHHDDRIVGSGSRARLLEGLPVREREAELGGTRTVWLEGGSGPPLILLHGPGESAVNWRWVIPDLAGDQLVIAPDLPGHGRSGGLDVDWTEDRIVAWLDALVEETCPEPPVLVGHVLGGAIGARFAADRGHRLGGLVLVDSLGLAPFRPALRFLAALVGFQAHPTEATYRWFMGQCAHDFDALRTRMGERWDAFVAYNLEMARGPQGKAAGKMLKQLGLPRIPREALEEIPVTTTLIWGRHDRANRLRVATEASERYGWPLHVIEDAADDPARDQPDAFVQALRAALDPSTHGGKPMSQAHQETTYESALAKQAAEHYQREFVPAIGRPVAERLIAAADPRPGERVLDVACGTGVVARLAADRVGPQGSVTGLDPNPAMLAVAREVAPSGASIAWHLAPAEDMPLGDHSFDLVLCGMGLQFFGDRVAALREIRRVLVSGGRMAANMPGPTPPPLQAMSDALARHVGVEAAGFVNAVFSLHEEQEVRALAERAGFREVAVRSEHVPLELGAPEEFLWSYIRSTPLAPAAAKLDGEGRAALQQTYVEACRPFLTDGVMKGGVRMTTLTAVA